VPDLRNVPILLNNRNLPKIQLVTGQTRSDVRLGANGQQPVGKQFHTTEPTFRPLGLLGWFAFSRGRANLIPKRWQPTDCVLRSALARRLRAVFGSGEKCPPIAATKSLTGHSQGATGVHEAIYSLLMMQNGFICESAHIDEARRNDVTPAVDDRRLSRQLVPRDRGADADDDAVDGDKPTARLRLLNGIDETRVEENDRRS